jgi:hypothetical protein
MQSAVDLSQWMIVIAKGLVKKRKITSEVVEQLFLCACKI